MKHLVLVCAHSDVQLLELITSQPYFDLARRTSTLRRVNSDQDVRGVRATTLFLLPGYEKGTRDAVHLLAYWHSREGCSVTHLVEEVVRGLRVFVPDEKQLAMAHHQTGYADFPKYFGKRRPDHVQLRYSSEYQQTPVSPAEKAEVTALGKLRGAQS